MSEYANLRHYAVFRKSGETFVTESVANREERKYDQVNT